MDRRVLPTRDSIPASPRVLIAIVFGFHPRRSHEAGARPARKKNSLTGWTAVVTRCGRICHQPAQGQSQSGLRWQKVGVKQTAEHIWLVSFMDYDLGYFDDETGRLEPIEDPFGPGLSPMSPE